MRLGWWFFFSPLNKNEDKLKFLKIKKSKLKIINSQENNLKLTFYINNMHVCVSNAFSTNAIESLIPVEVLMT